MATIELALRSMTAAERNLMGALAAAAEAQGASDLQQVPALAALAKPVVNRALRRFVLRTPIPPDEWVRNDREFLERCLQFCMFAGDQHARRFWPSAFTKTAA